MSRLSRPRPSVRFSAQRRFVFDDDASSLIRRGRLRPDALLDEVAHMRLVVEARHLVVGLRLQPRPASRPLGIGLEERQPAAMHEIVDERGDEDGLAGARQAGHAEAQRRRKQRRRPVGERVERQQRFVGEVGERLRSAGRLAVAWASGTPPGSRAPGRPRRSRRQSGSPPAPGREAAGERRQRRSVAVPRDRQARSSIIGLWPMTSSEAASPLSRISAR